MSFLSKNPCLATFLEKDGEQLACRESMPLTAILSSIENGTMVLLGNPRHIGVRPAIIGQPASIKINANIGTSPLCNNVASEMNKLKISVQAGADTVMDLSIAGDLSKIRQDMIESCPLPLGTVPLYAVAQRYIDAKRDVSNFSENELLEEIEYQAEQGVDFMTLHCGVTESNTADGILKTRIMGMVSRGGAIMARWMRMNKKENPLLVHYDKLLKCALKHNVTLSLGDGLRPGAGADAGDIAQWEEIVTLGRLARQAHEAGVQCMIEGPGHVPLNEIEAQIKDIKKICNGAPLYVLGPLVIDVCPGYDHIAGAIGGAFAVWAGADFLCYLTPAEHLRLPDEKDVRNGIVASKIAAQAGEVALGRKAALQREKGMSCARKSLDWEAMKQYALDPATICAKENRYDKNEACSMCGEFCAVKMLS